MKGYYERLAAESPRVRLDRLGETTEGRDFLLATITSETNQARLAEIQRDCARIADPRGIDDEERRRSDRRGGGGAVHRAGHALDRDRRAAVRDGVRLATRHVGRGAVSDRAGADGGLHLSLLQPRRARPRVVVVPRDGRHAVRGREPHPSCTSTTRDTTTTATGFMLSLQETRLVTEQLYSVWHPQVYWDVHQQGRTGERMFRGRRSATR